MSILLVIEKGILIGKVECLTPIDDLTIRIMSVLSAKRRPADETFKHDSAYRPPVALESVALSGEDLRSNVVRCADRGIGKNPAIRFAPCVGDASTVVDCEIYLIKGDRVSVLLLA